jgi:hypothetical protein
MEWESAAVELNMPIGTQSYPDILEECQYFDGFINYFLFFIYNLNQQSEFTFYKLMLCLLECLDGESSSGESPVPQTRSIGQFLLSRLFFFPLNRRFLRSGFKWVSVLFFFVNVVVSCVCVIVSLPFLCSLFFAKI